MTPGHPPSTPSRFSLPRAKIIEVEDGHPFVRSQRRALGDEELMKLLIVLEPPEGGPRYDQVSGVRVLHERRHDCDGFEIASGRTAVVESRLMEREPRST